MAAFDEFTDTSVPGAEPLWQQMTLDECFDACLNVIEKLISGYCTGVEYNSASECFLHYGQTMNGDTIPTSGVNHYKRKACGMF